VTCAALETLEDDVGARDGLVSALATVPTFAHVSSAVHFGFVDQVGTADGLGTDHRGLPKAQSLMMALHSFCFVRLARRH
jgi:hypothetical protein